MVVVVVAVAVVVAGVEVGGWDGGEAAGGQGEVAVAAGSGPQDGHAGQGDRVPEPDGLELVIEGAHAFEIGLDRPAAGFGFGGA